VFLLLFVVETKSECITSLKGLRIPHEIVVVLHKRTDNSKAIAEKLKKQGYPIRMFEYNHETSKPGYETLVTPSDNPFSLVAFYNFSFSFARYNWIMKWDADFKCSEELIDFLNNKLVRDNGYSYWFRHCLKCPSTVYTGSL
jgi:glycosyltransferase involved in cell wall biosynthesis